MDTDEKGRVKCPVTSPHLRGRIWFQATRAQHEHDVAVVKGVSIPCPYFLTLQAEPWVDGMRDAKRAILAALKAGADG